MRSQKLAAKPAYLAACSAQASSDAELSESEVSSPSAPSFQDNLQDPARLQQTLKAAGIEPTEDNIASRFMDEQNLAKKLVNNLRGAKDMQILNITLV